MTADHLLSLGGPPPEQLLADWGQLMALPKKALHNLWEILLPSLERAPDREMDKRAEGFCRLYEIPPVKLQAALRACRHLLQAAASQDLTAEQVAQDLALLCGEQQATATTLLSGYETARQKVRLNIVHQSLLDHGHVLVGLDWRLDNIMASDRGVALSQSVALVTLRMQRAGREEATTFYALPSVVSQIKLACTRIEALVAKAAPSSNAQPLPRAAGEESVG